MADGGKGSTPRPYSVDQKTFDANWDAIFKKDKSVIDEVSALIAEETLQETDNRITDYSNEDQ